VHSDVRICCEDFVKGMWQEFRGSALDAGTSSLICPCSLTFLALFLRYFLNSVTNDMAEVQILVVV
jgi:hypothetical protein